MKPEESERIKRTKLYIGCLPCLLSGWPNAHCDYHHVTEGRKRLGHLFGFGMCLWHHRGERDGHWASMSTDYLTQHLGPSFQRNKRDFIEQFGTERALVLLNDFALDLWDMQRWLEHCVPYEASGAIRMQHEKILAA